MTTMRDRSPFEFEDGVENRFEASLSIFSRLAVVESNYASKEYVAEVRWQVVKWLVGVALGSFAVGAGMVTLLVRLLS